MSAKLFVNKKYIKYMKQVFPIKFKSLNEATVKAKTLSASADILLFVIRDNRARMYYVDQTSLLRNHEELIASYECGKLISVTD